MINQAIIKTISMKTNWPTHGGGGYPPNCVTEYLKNYGEEYPYSGNDHDGFADHQLGHFAFHYSPPLRLGLIEARITPETAFFAQYWVYPKENGSHERPQNNRHGRPSQRRELSPFRTFLKASPHSCLKNSDVLK